MISRVVGIYINSKLFKALNRAWLSASKEFHFDGENYVIEKVWMEGNRTDVCKVKLTKKGFEDESSKPDAGVSRDSWRATSIFDDYQ